MKCMWAHPTAIKPPRAPLGMHQIGKRTTRYAKPYTRRHGASIAERAIVCKSLANPMKSIKNRDPRISPCDMGFHPETYIGGRRGGHP